MKQKTQTAADSSSKAKPATIVLDPSTGEGAYLPNAAGKAAHKRALKELKAEAKTAAAKKESRGKLGQILGHSVVSVIRAMGKSGWEFDDAKAALDHLKIAAKDHTVRMGLMRGRNRDKTRRIANLSAKQLDSLRVAVKAKSGSK